MSAASTTKTDVAAKRAAARQQAPEQPNEAVTTEPESENTQAKADDRGTLHHIHFVSDGFTTLGQVWYRGQELKMREGDDDWKRVSDSKGRTFFEVAEDEAEQIARYGEVKFRPGPWPHQTFTADDIAAMEREADRSDDPEEAIRMRKRAHRLATEAVPPGR